VTVGVSIVRLDALEPSALSGPSPYTCRPPNGSEGGEGSEPATPPERRREELACSKNWENQRLVRRYLCYNTQMLASGNTQSNLAKRNLLICKLIFPRVLGEFFGGFKCRSGSHRDRQRSSPKSVLEQHPRRDSPTPPGWGPLSHDLRDLCHDLCRKAER